MPVRPATPQTLVVRKSPVAKARKPPATKAKARKPPATNTTARKPLVTRVRKPVVKARRPVVGKKPVTKPAKKLLVKASKNPVTKPSKMKPTVVYTSRRKNGLCRISHGGGSAPKATNGPCKFYELTKPQLKNRISKVTQKVQRSNPIK